MATYSGQTTVATAGTAVRLSATYFDLGESPLMVKALPTNTGKIYIGGVNGDVSSANGLPLDPGDIVIFQRAGNLNKIWIDSAVNSEGVAWLMLSL